MRAVVMNKQLIELLHKQKQLSIKKYGHHSSVEPIHSSICQQMTILVKKNNTDAQWAKCLMLAFSGALRSKASIDDLAKRLDIYNLRWQPIKWTDIQRQLFEMQLHCRFDDWKRWADIAKRLFILSLSYQYSIQDLLSAIDARLEQYSHDSVPKYEAC